MRSARIPPDLTRSLRVPPPLVLATPLSKLQPRADLHRFVGILDVWFDYPQMPSIFKCQPKVPTNAKPPKQIGKTALKEAKRGQYRDRTV